MAGHSWVDDIAFVVSEIKRLQDISAEEMRRQDKDAFWHNIPAPAGKGVWIMGTKASYRLAKVVEEYISRQKNAHGRVDLNNVHREVGVQLSRTYFDQGKPVNHSTVMTVLHRAAKSALSEIESLTHYIPCQIVSRAAPSEVVIGPVRLIPRIVFEKEMAPSFEEYTSSLILDRMEKYPKLERYKEAAVDEMERDARKYAAFFIDGVNSYFSQFLWVAIVRVEGCDKAVSNWKAQQAVSAAVDSIRLFRNPGYGDRMSVGMRSAYDPKAAALTKNDTGKIDIAVYRGREGEPEDEEWWARMTTSSHIQDRIKMFTKLIEGILSPADLPPLAQRIVDGLSWFGSSCVDPNVAARILKLVTAMERVVLAPEERNEVSSKVIERCACHVFDEGKRNYDECLNRLKRVYDCRSRLAHGATSPFDPIVMGVYHDASLLCQHTLTGGLEFFEYLGLEKQKVSSRRLSSVYEALVTNVKSLNEGRRAVRIEPL